MKLRPQMCSVHTHSLLCDGKDTLEAMAAGAYEAGVRYFGASGHSPTAIAYDRGNVLMGEGEEYRRQVLALREAYRGRMEVLLGIEQDSCACGGVPAWAEYWIGSVHNLFDQTRGEYHPVDWDKEKLLACCREMFGGDFPALVEGYYALVADVARKKPTILGHFDLVTKFNEDGALFIPEEGRCRLAALEALSAAHPAATLLEINTGAMARGYRTTPYPALFLLRQWRQMGGSIIVTADAHSARDIVFGYEAAMEWARAAGYRESALLTASGVRFCPLEE